MREIAGGATERIAANSAVVLTNDSSNRSSRVRSTISLMPATCPALGEGLQVDPTVRPERRQLGSGFTLITPDLLIPQPRESFLRNAAPDTIAGWKALADGLLTNQSCVFRRNLEISSRYASLYARLPAYFKWAGMAAFASYHVRLALLPFRLDADRTGFVDIPHSLGRRKLLIEDVNTIRAINNGIFDDIFWAHLAYDGREDGSAPPLTPRSGAALRRRPLGFEAIERGRRILEDPTARPEDRRRAEALIWEGNVQLLEHEQRALVQPNLDRLSCRFARLFSIGSALSFEVRGVRHEASYFTSFYLYALTRGVPRPCMRARGRGSPATTTAGVGSRPASSPLPEARRRHAPGRRRPAPHLRGGARLRVEPLRPPARPDALRRRRRSSPVQFERDRAEHGRTDERAGPSGSSSTVAPITAPTSGVT